MAKANIKESVTGTKNLRKIFPYFKGLKKQMLGMFLLDLCIWAINVLTPLVLAQILVYFTDFNLERIIYYSIIWLLLFTLQSILNGFSAMCSVRWTRLSAYKLQTDFINKYLNISSATLDQQNSGQVTTRFTNDCPKISYSIDRIITNVAGVVAGIAYLVVGFWVNWIVAMYLVVQAILTFVLNNVVANKEAKLELQKNNMFDEIAGVNNETVRGWKDVKSLGLKNTLLEKIKKLSFNYAKFNIKRYQKLSWFWNFLGVLKNILNAGFYVLCGVLIYYGYLELASFLVLYMYSNKIICSLDTYTAIKKDLAAGEVAAKRVFDLFDEQKYPTEKFGNQKAEVKGKIKFSKVSFEYEKNKPVLKNISFEIQPNTMVAIVGQSGIGKSTILNLISKSYSPSKGEIYLDNYNLETLEEESIKKAIGLVLQTPYVFNMSLKENLKLAKPTATDEEIIKVCKQAQLDEFINTLPEKYDSLIGENGVILSGGQRQRLAIARALLKDSKILLFDEATSALDNKSQAEIKNVLFNLKKDHTIVVVAHRLSTIVDADNIMLVDEGKVVSQGNHKELLKSCKEYKELYNVDS
ncbi:MAG: ABC transporter ATP-binding protein [Clostridia bacterium]|nr:ABC transporter ATP-binding protein [Clostridia bacterium]